LDADGAIPAAQGPHIDASPDLGPRGGGRLADRLHVAQWIEMRLVAVEDAAREARGEGRLELARLLDREDLRAQTRRPGLAPAGLETALRLVDAEHSAPLEARAKLGEHGARPNRPAADDHDIRLHVGRISDHKSRTCARLTSARSAACSQASRGSSV